MTVSLQAIEWRHSGRIRRLLISGGDWLSEGLLHALPSAQDTLNLDDPYASVVAERGSLHLVPAEALRAATFILLIDPTNDERLRIVSLHAGNSHVAIHSLRSHAAKSAAEHAITLILALSRRLLAAYSSVVDGSWSEPPPGPTLNGKTLGIIGLDRSGQALAERASAFGMRLMYHDIERQLDFEARMSIAWRRFDQVLREADVVSLHLPATRDTVRLIDAPELASMKTSALLINVADGALIDEGSLVKALRNGDVAGAGLDCFAYEPLSPDSPLIGFENVVLTPGVAWMSAGAERKVWLDEIVEFLIRDS